MANPPIKAKQPPLKALLDRFIVGALVAGLAFGAGAFALMSAFLALEGLFAMALRPPFAAAATALLFAVGAAAFAFVLRLTQRGDAALSPPPSRWARWFLDSPAARGGAEVGLALAATIGSAWLDRRRDRKRRSNRDY